MDVFINDHTKTVHEKISNLRFLDLVIEHVAMNES